MEIFTIIIAIGISAFFIYCGVRIVQKMGYSGGIIILTFIPIVNFIFIIYLAFTEWPIEKRLKVLTMLSSQHKTNSNSILSSKSNIADHWKCKKCGQTNKKIDNYCSGCGEYK